MLSKAVGIADRDRLLPYGPFLRFFLWGPQTLGDVDKWGLLLSGTKTLVTVWTVWTV